MKHSVLKRRAAMAALVVMFILALSNSTPAAVKAACAEKQQTEDTGKEIYTGSDLGMNYHGGYTDFRLWTPAASAVRVLLFESPKAEEFTAYDMKKDIGGTWYARVNKDIKNQYYLYEVSVNGTARRTPDPYSVGLSANGKKSLIVDLKDTNPEGWEAQKIPAMNNVTDAVIYELHVRDFSVDENSGMKNKGKYLAFTENGTQGPNGEKTGVGHLKELGITHVHVLPVYDFGGTDENSKTDYNWGYGPEYYNAPEGQYATSPDGDARIRELKQMIMNLHNNGIRVVLDVVYNHTLMTGNSAFDIVYPKYYYRFDSLGNYSDASACGNEIATEKPMVRSFIINSLKYWMNEYKVDGFRFDLLGAYDTETMAEITKELRKVNPTVLLYGEPWAPGRSPLPESRRVVKGNQKGLGFAVFNDNLRDAIKGDTQGARPGFVQGVKELKEAVKRGIAGSIDDFTDSPTETVNYVSCHDDLCHWDKLKRSSPNSSEDELKKMSKLSNGIVLTSQGIAFIHGGEEFARTKKGEHNTFNKGDEFNKFEYGNKLKYKDLFEYYKGLIALRKAHPAFRMKSAEMVRENLKFFDTPEGTIGYEISNAANGDTWKRIVVLFNTNKAPVSIKIPPAEKWTVVVDEDEAGDEKVKTGISEISGGEATLEAVSMKVMYVN